MLVVVQPDTLLGWHRQAFRWVWHQRSKLASTKPKIAAETITLIKTMARNNGLWGAERIRGEMLKLGIHVSKRTIQKYMRLERGLPTSQTWSTFLHNHAPPEQLIRAIQIVPFQLHVCQPEEAPCTEVEVLELQRSSPHIA